MGPPQKSFTGEIAACVALMLLSIAAWAGFVLLFDQYVSMEAALGFMQRHKALGEAPEFIFGAVYGLHQPPEIVMARWQFQVSVVVVLVLVLGLTWTANRLWKVQQQEWRQNRTTSTG